MELVCCGANTRIRAEALNYLKFRHRGGPYNPDYEYIAYIDESGDTGLKRIEGVDQHGSPEWFTLPVVVIHKSEERNLNEWVGEMIAATGNEQIKDLHFAKLEPPSRTIVTKYMALTLMRFGRSKRTSVCGYDLYNRAGL